MQDARTSAPKNDFTLLCIGLYLCAKKSIQNDQSIVSELVHVEDD